MAAPIGPKNTFDTLAELNSLVIHKEGISSNSIAFSKTVIDILNSDDSLFESKLFQEMCDHFGMEINHLKDRVNETKPLMEIWRSLKKCQHETILSLLSLQKYSAATTSTLSDPRLNIKQITDAEVKRLNCEIRKIEVELKMKKYQWILAMANIFKISPFYQNAAPSLQDEYEKVLISTFKMCFSSTVF